MIALALLLALAPADTGGMPEALRRELSAVAHPRMRWGDISDVRDMVWQGYANRAWHPFWTIDGRLTQPARALLRELDSARTRGLDPRDYDAARLVTRADSLLRLDVSVVAEYDVLMSVAVARYAQALSRGRIDPRLMHTMLPASPDSVNLVVTLDQLAHTLRPDTILRNAEPRHATYLRMIELLATYRALERGNGSSTPDSVARRVRQIELALERWRWLPHSATAPWIVVNVPAFHLYALRTDREERGDMVRMKVVAGEPARHPTPFLVTNIVAVQFHPAWLVPTSIAVEEIRPQALRDSTFLDRQHYELLRGDSVVATTRANVARIGNGITVRQAPGPWNALGRIKFVTPNSADVYLHDTPAQADFKRAVRAFSHGCIRVEAPVALAEFALASETGWTADRIAEILADTIAVVVRLTRPIPVYVLYQTTAPAESGGLLSYPDVYGYDRKLDAILRGGYPYRSTLTP